MSIGLIVWSLFCIGLGVGLCLFAQKVIGRSKTAFQITESVKDWADGDR